MTYWWRKFRPLTSSSICNETNLLIRIRWSLDSLSPIVIYGIMWAHYNTPVFKDDTYTAQQAKNVEYHIWTHKGHPRARPHGRALGCLLWVYKRKLVILYIMRPHALINTTRSFAAGHKEDHDTWFVISSWCFGLKILTWLVSQWVSGKLHPRCH